MYITKQTVTKVLTLIALICIYVLLHYILLPGVSFSVIKAATNLSKGFTSMLMSSPIASYSIIATGLQPYISATMIIQILTSSFGFHWLRELKKQPGGTIKISEYIQYTMLGIAALQGVYIAHTLYASTAILIPRTLFYVTTTISVMFGSMALLWISNCISSLNIGSGVSFIVCTNMILSGDTTLRTLWNLYKNNQIPNHILVLIISLFVIVTFVTLILEQATYKVEVWYPNVEYVKTTNHVIRYLPLRLNNTGAMPLIMTSCFLEVPIMICNLLSKMGFYLHGIQYYIMQLTNPASIAHYIVYSVLIYFFIQQYSDVVFNPEETAQNLNSSGVLINGVRPGKHTERFLARVTWVLNSVTWGMLLITCVLASAVVYYINNSLGHALLRPDNLTPVIIISTLVPVLNEMARNLYNFSEVMQPYVDIVKPHVDIRDMQVK
jgi:preprotein translocase subunit SecY